MTRARRYFGGPAPPSRRKRREFSQMHVIFADALVLFVFCVSALLSYFDKQPVSDVAIAVITAYGAFATGGYFTLCGWRDSSRNKTGVTLAEMGTRDNGGGSTDAN